MPATPMKITVTAEAKAHQMALRGRLPEAQPHLTAGHLDVWNLEDLAHLPPANWLIDQVVEERGLTVFFGPDKVGKTQVLSSFLWAWCSKKLDWWFNPIFMNKDPDEGRERSVLYVLLEGQSTFFSRYKAWQQSQDLEGPLENFWVIAQGLSIFQKGMRWDDSSTWPESAKELRAVIADLKPTILVIDTLSRATAGMDENSPEMASVVGWLDQIRDEFGTSTVIVHHTSLADQDRPRGHSSLKGAVSSYVRIKSKDPEKPRAKLIVGPHRNAEAVNPQHGGDDYGYYFERKSYGPAFIIEGNGDRPNRPHGEVTVADQIKDLMQDGEARTLDEIAEEIGYDEANLRYLYEPLKKLGIPRVGKGLFQVRAEEPEEL